MGPSSGRRLLLLAAVTLAGAAVLDSVMANSSSSRGGPGYFNPNNFNPSMAVVMVVVVTAFFLLVFFLYLRRCAGPPLGGPEPDEDGRRPGIGVGIMYASRSRRTRGLDRAVLESFPTMAYADVKAHKAALECAVCLSDFNDDETLRLLPRCAHAFHTDCIDAWLASHVTCPVCRAVLAPDALPCSPAVLIPTTDQEQEQEQEHDHVPAPAALLETATAPQETETETEDQRIRREEAAELMRIGSVKRALRSKSSRQFPRSHTTGHSLVLAAPSPSISDSERYRLRLPDHVLREVVAACNLRRSASVQTGGDGTTRRGFGIARAGRSVRLGNSGRWPNMSLLVRNFSARLPAGYSVRRSEADAPAKAAKFAGDGKAVEKCDGGACPLGAHV